MGNIYDAVFDVHFVAHLGGWWFKMMIIRDTKVAWIISGTFELIEISLRHWLPNFWECWWDHVSNKSYIQILLIIFVFQLFLDLFGCNMFGIILGAITIKYMGVSRINWMYYKPQNKVNTCNQNMLVGTLEKFKP